MEMKQASATIPKSMNETRMQQNLDLFNFELREAQIDQLDAMNENLRSGPHPDEFDLRCNENRKKEEADAIFLSEIFSSVS
ncbi:hypothetical protein J9317_03510 [Metabacillus sp. KIGAM252]|uniref:NADP-dependent oxidoreductase domain-containing protein n=1 Tax=Metabacillus flavus TaxID=2823519 RepID=A0ABS5LAT3_9BACI|nr:hypothetical protein [Metabacillus flavus]MBS2967841.1 hypothetical protein [Metabacillus flavus]